MYVILTKYLKNSHNMLLKSDVEGFWYIIYLRKSLHVLITQVLTLRLRKKIFSEKY